MIGATNASNIGGNVGSDTKPIKIVNGIATAVTNDLALDSAVVHKNGDTMVGALLIQRPQYNDALAVKSTNVQVGTNGDVWGMQFYDQNNVSLGIFYINCDNTGKATLRAALRNADGTTRYVTLA